MFLRHLSLHWPSKKQRKNNFQMKALHILHFMIWLCAAITVFVSNRIAGMKDATVDLRLLVPVLHADAKIAAHLHRGDELTVELMTDVKLPETSSVQKITLKYGGWSTVAGNSFFIIALYMYPFALVNPLVIRAWCIM